MEKGENGQEIIKPRTQANKKKKSNKNRRSVVDNEFVITREKFKQTH